MKTADRRVARRRRDQAVEIERALAVPRASPAAGAIASNCAASPGPASPAACRAAAHSAAASGSANRAVRQPDVAARSATRRSRSRASRPARTSCSVAGDAAAQQPRRARVVHSASPSGAPRQRERRGAARPDRAAERAALRCRPCAAGRRATPAGSVTSANASSASDAERDRASRCDVSRGRLAQW